MKLTFSPYVLFILFSKAALSIHLWLIDNLTIDTPYGAGGVWLWFNFLCLFKWLYIAGMHDLENGD